MKHPSGTPARGCVRRFSHWLETVRGQRLLEEQHQLLTEAARRCHGDTLLWAGCHSAVMDSVSGCMIRHRLYLAPPRGVSEALVADQRLCELVHTEASLQELPFRNNSLDAVVLHHALDLTDDPRAALRELTRVLAPGGRLLICGFNRYSLLGLRRSYAQVVPDAFRGVRLLAPGRVQDWLTVLGFDVEPRPQHFAFGLPFWSSPVSEDARATLWGRLYGRLRRTGVPVGGAYLLSAVKQAAAVRPDWSARGVRAPALAPVAYPKLSAWNRVERDD